MKQRISYIAKFQTETNLHRDFEYLKKDENSEIPDSIIKIAQKIVENYIYPEWEI